MTNEQAPLTTYVVHESMFDNAATIATAVARGLTFCDSRWCTPTYATPHTRGDGGRGDLSPVAPTT